MVFFNVFFKTLGFLSGILIFIVVLNILMFFSNDFQKKQFEIIDGNPNSNNKIATIKLNGPIFSNDNILGNKLYNYINPTLVKSYLEELKDLQIKVLILNINSPGGTVSATAELENIIYEFKKITNAKVYVFSKEILASGGYWVATSADKIFASYGSIIGSIGVSGPSWFYYNSPISLSSGAFGQSVETKNGIEIFNQSAGESKDLFNPYRRPKNSEIEHLQLIVDEIYDDFLNKVSKSRKIDNEYIKNNVGALIYSSNQAKENFLIDDVINYDELINYIIKQNKFNDYRIYENKINNSIFGSFFSNFGNSFKSEDSYDDLCKNLEIGISLVSPLFLKKC